VIALDAPEQSTKLLDSHWVVARAIAAFARILFGTIQCAHGQASLAHQAIVARSDERILIGLGECKAIGIGIQSGEERAKVPAPQPGWARNSQRRERRWQEIDRLDHGRDMHALSDALPAHDEWYAHLLFVHGRPVIKAPMLAKLLPVIGRYDGDLTGTASAHKAHDSPDAVVGGRHFPVVCVDLGGCTPREMMILVQDVGFVWLEEVNP
jgi:hypothetical protein